MNNLQPNNCEKTQRKLVPKMLHFIGQAHYEREKGIGALIGVSQPTVSRWISGNLAPDQDHLTKILTTFHEACAHIRALFPIPANLHYLCSFAPKYTKDRVREANRALSESILAATERPTRKPGAIQIDLHIRAARLANEARAHCFVDDVNEPSVFVILVSNELTLREQHIVAFEEAYAHVMSKLIDDTSAVQHPLPFI